MWFWVTKCMTMCYCSNKELTGPYASQLFFQRNINGHLSSVYSVHGILGTGLSRKTRTISYFTEEKIAAQFRLVQLLSRVQLCDPMDCSTSGFPVHHQLPEFTQTHFHWVVDCSSEFSTLPTQQKGGGRNFLLLPLSEISHGGARESVHASSILKWWGRHGSICE